MSVSTTATVAKTTRIKANKYKPEKFKKGDTATCARFGLMVVTDKNVKGWAIGKQIAPVTGTKRGAASIVLTPTLCSMLRAETTNRVCELVDVTQPTVRAWRKALGITNPTVNN